MGYAAKELREEILKRDNYICQDCGRVPAKKRNLHVHHIKPDVEQGKSEPDNLVTLCNLCHSARPEDYNRRIMACGGTLKKFQQFLKCEDCQRKLYTTDATLFCGEVAILLQCAKGHQVIKFVSPSCFGKVL